MRTARIPVLLRHLAFKTRHRERAAPKRASAQRSIAQRGGPPERLRAART